MSLLLSPVCSQFWWRGQPDQTFRPEESLPMKPGVGVKHPLLLPLPVFLFVSQHHLTPTSPGTRSPTPLMPQCWAYNHPAAPSLSLAQSCQLLHRLLSSRLTGAVQTLPSSLNHHHHRPESYRRIYQTPRNLLSTTAFLARESSHHHPPSCELLSEVHRALKQFAKPSKNHLGPLASRSASLCVSRVRLQGVPGVSAFGASFFVAFFV